MRDARIKQDVVSQRERSIVFNIDFIIRELDELEEEFNKDSEKASDDDLFKWRSELQLQLTKFDKLADYYKDILQSPITDADRLVEIKNIGERYDKLCTIKRNFAKSLSNEISIRELDKDRTFNKSLLNIKLEKFGGYESKTDYYTFRSNFEKIYLQTTPKRLLPDLLKNIFLEDPALSLVKGLDEIDIIWDRLKLAYGNA